MTCDASVQCDLPYDVGIQCNMTIFDHYDAGTTTYMQSNAQSYVQQAYIQQPYVQQSYVQQAYVQQSDCGEFTLSEQEQDNKSSETSDTFSNAEPEYFPERAHEEAPEYCPEQAIKYDTASYYAMPEPPRTKYNAAFRLYYTKDAQAKDDPFYHQVCASFVGKKGCNIQILREDYEALWSNIKVNHMAHFEKPSDEVHDDELWHFAEFSVQAEMLETLPPAAFDDLVNDVLDRLGGAADYICKTMSKKSGGEPVKTSDGRSFEVRAWPLHLPVTDMFSVFPKEDW